MRGWGHGTAKKYPQEVRERAVRLGLENERGHESQSAAIKSVAEKMKILRKASAYFVQAELDRRRE